jgi:hypothetical protein
MSSKKPVAGSKGWRDAALAMQEAGLYTCPGGTFGDEAAEGDSFGGAANAVERGGWL